MKVLAGECSIGSIRKALRQKDILVNNSKVKTDVLLNNNDNITIFLPDTESPKPKITFDAKTIIYEDDYILIVNKRDGLQTDKSDSANSLDDEVNSYLHSKKQKGFLCHRLDTNTSGLVIFTKDKESEKIITGLISKREINKFYLAVIHGEMKPAAGTISNFLLKDTETGKVLVYRNQVAGSLSAVTEYKTLKTSKNFSIVELKLITGRTHQIRAHLADAGHPIAGDNKYGSTKLNRELKLKKQLLCAYKICFNFSIDAGKLNYLKDKEFSLDTKIIYDTYEKLTLMLSLRNAKNAK